MQVVNERQGDQILEQGSFRVLRKSLSCSEFSLAQQPLEMTLMIYFPCLFVCFSPLASLFSGLSCYTATRRFMDWDHGGRATNSASAKFKASPLATIRKGIQTNFMVGATTRRMKWKKLVRGGGGMQPLLLPFIMLVILSTKNWIECE